MAVSTFTEAGISNALKAVDVDDPPPNRLTMPLRIGDRIDPCPSRLPKSPPTLDNALEPPPPCVVEFNPPMFCPVLFSNCCCSASRSDSCWLDFDAVLAASLRVDSRTPPAAPGPPALSPAGDAGTLSNP